jgi:hypothetical protein
VAVKVNGEAFMAVPRILNRRQLLRGAGVATGVAVAGLGLAPAASADDEEEHGETLSGSWLVTRQDRGSPDTVKTVLSFAAGRVIVVHDIDPAGPPFTGTWAGEQDRRFRATVWTGQSGGPGEPGVTIEVELRGRTQRGTMSGTYTFTATAAGGQQTGTGSLTGLPIRA